MHCVLEAGSAFSMVYMLKVIYHPLYDMNNYVLIWGDCQSPPLYRVISYHVTLWEGHVIANHPI